MKLWLWTAWWTRKEIKMWNMRHDFTDRFVIGRNEIKTGKRMSFSFSLR